MIPETLQKVLADESIVAIVTRGKDGPHVVNTWNSYITLTPEDFFMIPVGRMKKTEENIKQDKRVLMTIGSRNVQGLKYVGTGFLITGTAAFEDNGERFSQMKACFPWMRAVLVIKAETITQTL